MFIRLFTLYQILSIYSIKLFLSTKLFFSVELFLVGGGLLESLVSTLPLLCSPFFAIIPRLISLVNYFEAFATWKAVCVSHLVLLVITLDSFHIY
jgi:hypothetical protein